MPRVGILGSLVWDQIYGRDPLSEPVEEWGGIAYALAALDASVAPGWEIVPLVKVGQDLAGKAREFLGGLRRITPGGRWNTVGSMSSPRTAHVSGLRAASNASRSSSWTGMPQCAAARE